MILYYSLTQLSFRREEAVLGVLLACLHAIVAVWGSNEAGELHLPIQKFGECAYGKI